MAKFCSWNSSRCPQFLPRYLLTFQTWYFSSHISIKASVVKALFLVYHFNHIICLTLNITIGPHQQITFKGLSNYFLLSSLLLAFLQ